jgi:hypothetical protein
MRIEANRYIPGELPDAGNSAEGEGALAEVSRKECSEHKTIGLLRMAESQTRIAGSREAGEG